MKPELRDELRRILRETDSAQADAELTPEEIRALRRTVLTAVPEPRRRWLSSPALAGAAVAVLAIVVLALWPGVRPGMNSRATDDVPSGTKQEPPARSETLVGPTRNVPSGTNRQAVVPDGTAVGSPTASAAGGRKHRDRRTDRIASAQLVEPASNDEEPRNRQVQFSTPGGTRVIWILTTDNAL